MRGTATSGARSISGLEAHKAFQFDGPDRMDGHPKIWWQITNSYRSSSAYPVAANEVARLSVRHYAQPMRQLADGTWIGVPAGPNVTSGSRGVTPITPYKQWNIKPERWVRHWQLIEYGMDPNPWRTNPRGTLMSLWVADEDRAPVQVYDRLQVTLWPPGVQEFWIEMNTSQNDVKAGRPNLVAYFRSVVMLKDIRMQTYRACDVSGYSIISAPGILQASSDVRYAVRRGSQCSLRTDGRYASKGEVFCDNGGTSATPVRRYPCRPADCGLPMGAVCEGPKNDFCSRGLGKYISYKAENSRRCPAALG